VSGVARRSKVRLGVIRAEVVPVVSGKNDVAILFHILANTPVPVR